MPGPASLPWEVNDVPHGVIHHHFYRSGIVGDDRDFFVYTPPGYNPKVKKPYPTLYLLHGFSDDASAWTAVGVANVILDNLIAQGEGQAHDCRYASRLWRAGDPLPGHSGRFAIPASVNATSRAFASPGQRKSSHRWRRLIAFQRTANPEPSPVCRWAAPNLL